MKVAITGTSGLAILIAVFGSLVVNADDVHECKNDYDLALSVMQQRQKDNNLIEAMQLFTDRNSLCLHILTSQKLFV